MSIEILYRCPEKLPNKNNNLAALHINLGCPCLFLLFLHTLLFPTKFYYCGIIKKFKELTPSNSCHVIKITRTTVNYCRLKL